ncbi:hypothetical protein BC826DRAFT_1176945 [Russula brevipes]|nr:hypothetical protein BC826DRAFT_1176945 [Russula brevipes]
MFEPSPLHLASRGGYADVVRVFLEHGADAGVTHLQVTPLQQALQHGHVDVARVLLEHGANPNPPSHFYFSPLQLALEGGHVDIVRTLLEHGANPTLQDRWKWTPLHRASEGGHVEIAQLLLEHGADTSVQDHWGYTALHRASENGYAQIARLLLEHGAETNAWDAWERTPLHRASENGHAEIARLLLERGVDTNVRDHQKCTPLHRASENGHSEIARLLLEHGAETNAWDACERTPLHRASENGHAEIARLLLEHGAETNAWDAWERTPLHRASENGHAQIARLLLERGVDTNVRDHQKFTPLHRASDFFSSYNLVFATIPSLRPAQFDQPIADLYPNQSPTNSYQPQSSYHHRPQDSQEQLQQPYHHLSSPAVVYPPRLLASSHSSPDDTANHNSPPKTDSAAHSPQLQQQHHSQHQQGQQQQQQNNMTKTDTKPQTTFLTKLYALLERPENHHMIRWDPAGEHIIVERPEQLALHVLPSIYRQSRFASFSRQLNIYGFMRKVNLRNVDPAIDDPDASTWFHPTLNRHSPPEVVANFKRRVPPRLPKPRKRPDAEQNPAIPPPRSASGLGGRARGFSAPGSYQPLPQAGPTSQWGNTYNRALPPLTVPSDPPLSHGGMYPSSHALHPVSPADDHGSFNSLHYPSNREAMWQQFKPLWQLDRTLLLMARVTLPPHDHYLLPIVALFRVNAAQASSLFPDSRPATCYSVSSMSSLPYDENHHYPCVSLPRTWSMELWTMAPRNYEASQPEMTLVSCGCTTFNLDRQAIRYSVVVFPPPMSTFVGVQRAECSSTATDHFEQSNLYQSTLMLSYCSALRNKGKPQMLRMVRPGAKQGTQYKWIYEPDSTRGLVVVSVEHTRPNVARPIVGLPTSSQHEASLATNVRDRAQAGAGPTSGADTNKRVLFSPHTTWMYIPGGAEKTENRARAELGNALTRRNDENSLGGGTAVGRPARFNPFSENKGGERHDLHGGALQSHEPPYRPADLTDIAGRSGGRALKLPSDFRVTRVKWGLAGAMGACELGERRRGPKACGNARYILRNERAWSSGHDS